MIRTVSRYLPTLLIAPAVLPLLYAEWFVYPYMTPKTLALRALGVVLLAVFLYLFLSGKELYGDRLREKATWIPGLLLGVAYVTSLFSVDFYTSFWSSFERGDGLLTLSVLTLFFYVTIVCAEKTLFDRFIRLVAYVASFVALYTLFQWVQGETGINIPLIAAPSGRYGSTIGNAAFLASYFGMSVFLTLIAARSARARMQRLLYVSAALQVFGIFISATRGTILALLAACALGLVYTSVRGQGRARTYARAALVAILLLGATFLAFRSTLANAPIEPVRRLASISLTDITVSSRLFVWEHMLAAGIERPLAGVGAEHIDSVFNQFYDPAGIVEEWFDRAHNAYLDYFIQYGVGGLLLFLVLLISFGRRAYAYMREDHVVGGMLILLLITYTLQNMFVFDTALTLYLLLMVFAFLIVRTGSDESIHFNVPASLPRWSPALAFGLLFFIIPVSIQPMRANTALAQGYVYHVIDAGRSVSTMERGLSLGTYADLEYGYQSYQMYIEEQQTMLQGGAQLTAYRFVRETLAANYARYPYDAQTALYYAHILDLAPEGVSADESLLVSVIERAISLSPKRAQSWYLRANISLKKGDQEELGSPERARYYEEGIAVLKEYAAHVPDLAEPRYVIATLYLDIGKVEDAAPWAAEGLSVYAGDEHTARRAARYYITIEDWPHAARMMSDVVRESEGTDYKAMYDLAKILWLTGERDDSVALVERIRAESPGLFESDPNFVAEYNAVQ